MGFIKIILFSTLVFSKSKLLEFSTRQNIHNLKYDALNGITFYLKGTKSLAYSAKNKANVVIENKVDSEFDVIKVNEDQYIISVKEDNYRDLAFIKDAQIFLYSIKSAKLTPIGSGSYPIFHPLSNYMSYTREDKNKLFIEVVNTRNYLDRFSIPLNSRDLLFRPQVAILNDGIIYYTDRNKEFLPQLNLYNNRSKKNYILREFKKENTTLSLALNKDKLFLLESEIGPKSYLELSSLKVGSIDYSKKIPLFNSQFGPAFNLNILNNELFFITTLKSENSNLINKREVVSFSLEDKKLYQRSDLNYVSTIVVHNDTILVPYKDDIFLLKNKAGKYTLNKEIKSEL